MNPSSSGPADLSEKIAHYELRGRLGEGGFGQVFEAWDTQLQRRVAIKRLKGVRAVDPARLVREARMAASLRHAAFVRIHAIEDDQDSKSIVMELVPGLTLKALLKSAAPDPAGALEIVRQVAEAMREAHAARLIHGDLKPANLIVEPDGKVRILDFGLAAHADAQETGTLTALDPQGTIAYMAPERLLGAPPDAQGDIYSLGVILYELLTGVRPFATLNGLALAAAQVQTSSATWNFPKKLAPELIALVRAMTAREPAARLHSMQDVQQHIALLHGPATPASPIPLRSLTGSRRRAWLGSAAVLVLVLALAAWLALPYASHLRQTLTPWSASLAMKQGQQALLLYDRPGSLNEATRVFDTTLEHDPHNAGAVAGLALAYAIRYTADGQDKTWLQKADAGSQQALQLNDQLALAHVARAWVLNQTDSKAALREADRALELEPDNVLATFIKVNILALLRRSDEAIALGTAAVQKYPKEHCIANAVGSIYFEQANYRAAERFFRLSIQREPDAELGYANLDAVLLKQNRSDEALQVLQQGLQIRPSARLYNNLGTDLFYRRDYIGAVAAFRHAVSPTAGNPDYYLGWANLADALLWLPDGKTEARAAYQKARTLLEPLLQHAPDNVQFNSRMALYAARTGDGASAERLIAHARALAPRNPGVLYRAALSHELLGKRSAALEELAAALDVGYPLKSVEAEPDLAALRRDPRFVQHEVPVPAARGPRR